MIVGTFTKNETGTFEGHVETLIFSAELRVATVEQDNDKAPNYRIYTTHGNVEIGAGWNAKSQAGNPYISVKIDDPSFAYPMWAALTKSDDGYNLNWSRPKRNPEATGDAETL